MKIIFGAVRPDAGEVHFSGAPVVIASPHDARNLGIAMVFQHFSLFDTLTVTENIALACRRSEVGGMKQLAERIRATAARYGLPLEPNRHVTRCPWASASAWRSSARCWPGRNC